MSQLLDAAGSGTEVSSTEVSGAEAEAGGPFTTTPIALREEHLEAVRYNDDGLVPAIIQERGTGEVLMLAWMNAESLRRTLETGRTWFWSRSRQEYWCKGETSGDRQYVRGAWYDCDGDTILVQVDQEGAGACHEGTHSCFSHSFSEPADGGDPPA